MIDLLNEKWELWPRNVWFFPWICLEQIDRITFENVSWWITHCLCLWYYAVFYVGLWGKNIWNEQILLKEYFGTKYMFDWVFLTVGCTIKPQMCVECKVQERKWIILFLYSIIFSYFLKQSNLKSCILRFIIITDTRWLL